MISYFAVVCISLFILIYLYTLFKKNMIYKNIKVQDLWNLRII